jgi:molybdopterin-guanine dinucleotide biosynthesis protein A
VDGELGAVVLSGGGGARLGGADKATIEVGGHTLLEHALHALVEVTEVVVVGPDVPTSRPVTFAREDPVGGGPAAGLLAGLRRFARTPEKAVVLAVDMPLVTAATVRRLVVAAAGSSDGAVLVDEDGRLQHLCGVYSVPALLRHSRAAGPESDRGRSMRSLLAGLDLAQVAAVGDEARDVDTWQDLATLRGLVGD